MKFHNINIIIFLILITSSFTCNGVASIKRILHQPLSPESSSPPPSSEKHDSSQPPPPLTNSSGYGSDQPFFPEVPSTGAIQNPNRTPPSPTPPPTKTNGSGPIPTKPQPARRGKKVALAISVGIVTLGMLSALAFYLYRHKVKHPIELHKLVGDDHSRAPPSDFLYIGTVEPMNQISVNESPYHMLHHSERASDRYRPSPDLQPLPPLDKDPPVRSLHNRSNDFTPSAAVSSDDEETRDGTFYTPTSSVGGNDDGFWTPSMRSISGSRTNSMNSVHSKRFLPISWVSGSSPDVVKHAIIPSIKVAPPPSPPPPPPLPMEESETEKPQIEKLQFKEEQEVRSNMSLLKAISSSSPSHQKPKPTTTIPPPPPPPPPLPLRASPWPPPPPPRPLLSTPQKVDKNVVNGFSEDSPVSQDAQFQTPNSRDSLNRNSTTHITEDDNECSSSGRRNGDDMDERRPKLKSLHWDKVRTTSDRATVWDKLKSSSFQLNEDMMESLFGCKPDTSANKEPATKGVVPPAEKQHRVLDPKKSQNIAILLRALNVTKDEVVQALLDGNPEGLGAELFETLVKMAPTKEEEIKLKDYTGDILKLGSAERFLKGMLDIPFAFRRVEAMLYRANFDAEVKYLTKSFDTLEVASAELKKSRLFLKLLEAVLQTGNRMNVGTNRGDAKAFKLDTLLKLVDIKGTDGKTTLLHFVVQEIIKSEGMDSGLSSAKKNGLQIVSGLSRELGSVKGAAGMDSDVLSNYVSKLETGLEKVRLVLQLEKPAAEPKFFESTKTFFKEAEKQISQVKAHEKRALSNVREVTAYFHGDTAIEEAHPLRIFLIVRDFLLVLDNVCKEVGRMDDRSVIGTGGSFRISINESIPILAKSNARHDESSGDEG